MKRFSFSTFQADEFNREALDACRAIAELQPLSPMPVLLLGDQGCGKTHLLYSIVNHVRAASETTGLACVTASQFPEKVRQIIKDPAPVEKARSAILLVDQLESFTDRLEELDALVRIFLDHGHYVLLTSNVHPARLKSLSNGFRSLLEKGRILRMKPHVLAEAAAVSAGNPVMEDLLKRQQEIIHRLRDDLERIRERATPAEDAPEIRRQLEVEQRRVVELTQQIEAQRQAFAAAAAANRETFDTEVEKAGAEIRSLRREIDEGQTALAAVSEIKDEVVRLTQQRDRVQAEREAWERERAMLVADLARKIMLEEEVNSLRLQLHTARQQGEQAQNEARSVVDRAHAVLTQVEESRSKFAEMEQKHHEQIEELERRVAQYAEVGGVKTDAGEAAGALDTLRREYDAQRHELEAQLNAAKADARAASKARDDAIDKLDKLTAAHAALELDIEQMRDQLGVRVKEMESLQHEAAAQVAAANAQAGDIEGEYVRLLSSTDISHQTAHVVVAGLQNLHQRLVEQAEAVDRLATRLVEAADRAEEDLSRAPADRSGNGRAQRDHSEPDLFEGPGGADASGDRGNAEGVQEEPEAASFDLDAVIRAKSPFNLHQSPSEL